MEGARFEQTHSYLEPLMSMLDKNVLFLCFYYFF